MKVFISHSSKDQDLYNELFRALRGDEHDAWDPKLMGAGEYLNPQILEAIQKSKICIFLATENSMESSWCAAELGAFWGAGKKIIAYAPNNNFDKDKLPPHLKEQLWVSSYQRLARNLSTDQITENEYHIDVVNKDIELDDLVYDVIDSDDRIRKANLIHYSGDNISRIIERLLSNHIEVNLLLAHPIQLIKSGNFELLDVQLTKMRAFNNKVRSDLPNREKLDVRYYTSWPSLRGINLDNVFCSVGWYTHSHNEIHGHDNTQLVEYSNSTRKSISLYFDRIFNKVWSEAIPYGEDKKNLESLFSFMPMPIINRELDGIVVRGHGVASGIGINQDEGSIKKQKRFFDKIIDWEHFWPGTINVSISPNRYLWKNNKATYEGINWHVDQPKEDFGISKCKITVKGESHDAWAYCPLPKTKTQNLHDPTMIEIIAPKIEGLEYGDKVSVVLNDNDFIVLQ